MLKEEEYTLDEDVPQHGGHEHASEIPENTCKGKKKETTSKTQMLAPKSADNYKNTYPLCTCTAL